MSRWPGVLATVVMVLLAMAFAAGNAGHRVTVNLGFVTLYRTPVTLVAFGGLLVGMLVMFVTGIASDLKVRRILRERFQEEVRKEQSWSDRAQRDLFAQDDPVEDRPGSEAGEGEGGGPGRGRTSEGGTHLADTQTEEGRSVSP